jgi:hypothetical protein
MRHPTGRRSQQRTLVFASLDLWQRLPAAERLRCQTLCGQLLRAVLHAEAPPRSDDDRETPPDPS